MRRFSYGLAEEAYIGVILSENCSNGCARYTAHIQHGWNRIIRPLESHSVEGACSSAVSVGEIGNNSSSLRSKRSLGEVASVLVMDVFGIWKSQIVLRRPPLPPPKSSSRGPHEFAERSGVRSPFLPSSSNTPARTLPPAQFRGAPARHLRRNSRSHLVTARREPWRPVPRVRSCCCISPGRIKSISRYLHQTYGIHYIYGHLARYHCW